MGNINWLQVLSTTGYILIAIALLLVMIMIHEFGHYTAGKLLKFKINEFSVGFGKAIFSKTKKNGEKFSIRLIPLGGYCAFEGEDEDGNSSPGAFNNQAPWKRLIVLFMGAFFNFLSACIVAVAALMISGPGTRVVTAIKPNDYNMELCEGDIIKSVDGHDVTAVFNMSYLVSNCPVDTDIHLGVERDGQYVDVVVRKVETEPGSKTYEIGFQSKAITYGFGGALLHAVPYSGRIAYDCLEILWSLITGRLGISAVGGPITTIDAIAQVVAISPAMLVQLFVLIGVNLATFNLLPFPSLDGARMVFVLIEWIRGKPVSRKVEGYVHTIGLFILFAFVIVVDLIHLLRR